MWVRSDIFSECFSLISYQVEQEDKDFFNLAFLPAIRSSFEPAIQVIFIHRVVDVITLSSGK